MDTNADGNKSPNNSTTNCPSCGASNATFSKSQRKKPYRDRKCKLCVEQLQLMPHAAAGDSANANDTPSTKKDKKRNKRKANDNESMTSDDKAVDSERKEGHFMDIGGGEGVFDEEDINDAKPGAKKSKASNENELVDENNAGNWSPMHSDEENDGLVDTPADKKSSTNSKVQQRKNTNVLDDSDSEAEFDDENNAGNWSPMIQPEDEKDENDGLEDTPAGKKNCDTEIMNTSQPIPKKKNVRNKMTLAREQALGNKEAGKPKKKYGKLQGHSSDEDDDDINARHESLEVIKQHILGRPVASMYDIDHASEAAQSNNQHRLIMDASTAFTDGSTVANHLRQDLTCPICHDRLCNPVSLLCGHSFCQVCLNWWLDKADASGKNDVDSEDEEGNVPLNVGSCPSCREPIPSCDNGDRSNSNRPNIAINTALKAVLDTLYGSEMNQRRLAQERQERKAKGGEMGGLHTRGYEEIEPLPNEEDGDELEHLLNDGKSGKKMNGRDTQNGWLSLFSSSNQPGWQDGGRGEYSRGTGASISIRRNIVLDDTDQRYQLSLGLTKCTYSNGSNSKKSNGNGHGVLDIELCLLGMEEDEIDDSGFPTFVNEGSDDEALICTGNDRIHTCIESSVRVVPTSALEKTNVFSSAKSQVKEVTLSRGMIGRDGSVRFRIDLKKALDDALIDDKEEEANSGGKDADYKVVKLRFRHVDTGAVLELRLPTKKDTDEKMGVDSDGEIEFCGTSKPVARNDASRYLLDDYEENHDEPNEYEEDGFLVHGSQDSDEEDCHSNDDDDGECEVCHHGGDLIVCDGGDHEGGCGRMYHIDCIGRSIIPPGELGVFHDVQCT